MWCVKKNYFNRTRKHTKFQIEKNNRSNNLYNLTKKVLITVVMNLEIGSARYGFEFLHSESRQHQHKSRLNMR